MRQAYMSAVLLPTQYEFYIIGISRHKTIRLGVNISTYLGGNGAVDQPGRVGRLGAGAGGNGRVAIAAAAVRGYGFAGGDAGLLLARHKFLEELAPTKTQGLLRVALVVVYSPFGLQKMCV